MRYTEEANRVERQPNRGRGSRMFGVATHATHRGSVGVGESGRGGGIPTHDLLNLWGAKTPSVSLGFRPLAVPVRG